MGLIEGVLIVWDSVRIFFKFIFLIFIYLFFLLKWIVIQFTLFVSFLFRRVAGLFGRKRNEEDSKERDEKQDKSDENKDSGLIAEVKKTKADYKKFELIERKSGDYENFETKLNDDSKIILVFGKRGGGKSGLGFKLMENIHSKSKKKCYVLGVGNDLLPSWIESVDDVDDVEENSVLLIDEGAISFSSRESMKSQNKNVSKTMAVARHKDLTLIFLTQNTGMIDKNILKLSDSLIVKEGSLLQIEMERPEIKKFYEKANSSFKKVSDDKRKYAYIIDSDFEGLVKQDLPSFWDVKISKNQSNKGKKVSKKTEED